MTSVLTDFANIKLMQKRYELANPMQFYLIQKDIKRWNIFSQYFRYSNASQQNAVLFESRKKKLKITCQICFYLSLDNRAKIQCLSVYSNKIQKFSIFLEFPREGKLIKIVIPNFDSNSK